MGDLKLTFAMTPYDRIMPLITGQVKPDGITLEYYEVPGPDIFYQQFKFERFDVSEMSMSASLIARARGWPYRLLPVFHNRAFYYTWLTVRRAAGIRRPEDLKGKRIGFAEYAQSLALWTRGILQHEFGVRPEDVEWYQERNPAFSHAHAAGFTPPPGVRIHYAKTDLATMLVRGELDAAYVQSGASIDRAKSVNVWNHPALRPLFADHQKESIRYYKKTGVIPAQHTTAVRESILKEHPWVATSLMRAFEQAKRLSMGALYGYPDYLGLRTGTPSMLLYSRREIEEQRAAFGDDPYPYGLRANAKVMDMVQTFSVEQGLTPRKQPWNELFAQEVLLAEELASG